MRKSAHVLLLLVFIAGVCPIWRGMAVASVVVDKLNVSDTKGYKVSVPEDGQVRRTGEMELDLLAINVALSKSLTESRATNVELEERIKRLEEMLIDIAPDSPPRIFFCVQNEGVKAYSWTTSDAILVKRTEGYNAGIAYDSVGHKLYWSSTDTIYRGNRNDAEAEVVFSSDRYGVIMGLSHDWITGNLYGVSLNGIVFVCNTTSGEQLDCEVLLSGQGDLHTIALNPTDGLMYFTDFRGNAVLWAEMDGTRSAVLLSGLVGPVGITVDLDSSRLYWVENSSSKIQSSDLQGNNIRTVMIDSETFPWGIATMQDRVYWGTQQAQKFQSVRKAGEDVRTLYEGQNFVHQLVVATSNLPRNRTNHCKLYNCSRICVLTATYARCVN